ncbi:MAG: hypothetical protein OXH15_21780 [Gammaproteobacteria bacterium]|nr:hypothetical protein [Gammaproteobacteria bacterium]
MSRTDLQWAMDASPYVRHAGIRVVEFDGVGRLAVEMPLVEAWERRRTGGDRPRDVPDRRVRGSRHVDGGSGTR